MTGDDYSWIAMAVATYAVVIGVCLVLVVGTSTRRRP